MITRFKETLQIFGISASIALVACNYTPPDPCATGTALFSGLSPEEKENCQECGATVCSGDTGGEENDSGLVTGRKHLTPQGLGDLTQPLVYEGALFLETEFAATAWEVFPASECPTLSAPYPCARSWWDSSDGPGESCRLCDSYGDFTAPPATSNVGWRLCPVDDTLFAGPSPATWWELPSGSYADGPGWLDEMRCDDPYDPIGYECPMGMIGIWESDTWSLGNTVFMYPPHTCICDGAGEGLSDDSCQQGAVCEGGYTIKNGLPVPTICVPEGNEGDANGIAPEGPIVYGLDTWEEGITFDGTDIVMSTSFYLRAFGTSIDSFDDDQRIDLLTGEITHCGRESLCDFLNFEVGDVLDMSAFDQDLFESGEPQPVILTRVDGSETEIWVHLDSNFGQ